MTNSEDYNQLADQLDEQADALRKRGEEVDEHIGEVREDWEHKRADPSVPGAVNEWDEPDEDGDDDDDDDDPDEDSDDEDSDEDE
jgi:hypothetical protein